MSKKLPRPADRKGVDELPLKALAFAARFKNAVLTVSKKIRGVRHVEVKILKQTKKNLKLEVQLDFEDVENSEFDYFFGENFRFKAPQLSEKSSESYVLHI